MHASDKNFKLEKGIPITGIYLRLSESYDKNPKVANGYGIPDGWPQGPGPAWRAGPEPQVGFNLKFKQVAELATA